MKTLNEQISEVIEKEPVAVFMKGTPFWSVTRTADELSVTDYLLVRETSLSQAVAALAPAGHTVH